MEQHQKTKNLLQSVVDNIFTNEGSIPDQDFNDNSAHQNNETNGENTIINETHIEIEELKTIDGFAFKIITQKKQRKRFKVSPKKEYNDTNRFIGQEYEIIQLEDLIPGSTIDYTVINYYGHRIKSIFNSNQTSNNQPLNDTNLTQKEVAKQILKKYQKAVVYLDQKSLYNLRNLNLGLKSPFYHQITTIPFEFYNVEFRLLKPNLNVLQMQEIAETPIWWSPKYQFKNYSQLILKKIETCNKIIKTMLNITELSEITSQFLTECVIFNSHLLINQIIVTSIILQDQVSIPNLIETLSDENCTLVKVHENVNKDRIGNCLKFSLVGEIYNIDATSNDRIACLSTGVQNFLANHMIEKMSNGIFFFN